MSKVCSSSESDAPISSTPDMQPKDSLGRKDLSLIIHIKLFITSTIKHASRIHVHHCCLSISIKLYVIGLHVQYVLAQNMFPKLGKENIIN